MSFEQTTAAVTHIAYSDESHYTTGRYRGVAVVTLCLEDRERIVSALQAILSERGLKEIGWKNLDGANTREAAKSMLTFVLDNARAGRLRIDILTWDTQDSRHEIRNRDDLANLDRMYYHLLKNTLGERWPNSCRWILYPDEGASDWSTLRSCLSSGDFKIIPRINEENKRGFFLEFSYLMKDIIPRCSHEEPLIQVADLLAGLCIYSRTNIKRLVTWSHLNYTDKDEEECWSIGERINARDGERCHLLRWLYLNCSERKMGVSLRSRPGLWTAQPENPLNFWWYEVQNEEMDKAPQKEKKVKKPRTPKIDLPGLN